MPKSDPLLESVERLRPWIEDEMGMSFGDDRFARLHAAVKRLLDDRPFGKSATLTEILDDATRRHIFFERLVSDLTIGESFFFRNRHHFHAIREEVFPAIFQDNVQTREVRIWSAGCSTGEEPYSLAIALDQYLRTRTDGPTSWNAHILATDINVDFLERARQATYRNWSFRQTDIHNDRRYFSEQRNQFTLVRPIAERVRFAYLNLVKDEYPSSLMGTLGLDLIVFRNVAIYLRPEVTGFILERFQRSLRPGGWLLLGETEVMFARAEGFEVVRFDNATLYRKPKRAIPESKPRSVSIPVQASKETLTPRSAPVVQERIALDTPSKPAIEEHSLARVHRLMADAQWSKARELLQSALEQNPLLQEAHLLQGAFAEEDGDLGAAERAYRAALYLDRQSSIAHFRLGLIQQQLGHRVEARRSFQTVIELATREDGERLVPHGEGLCFARLSELAEAMHQR